MTEHDLRFPQVRGMVERNHVPVEMWTVAGELLGVRCRCCGHDWPCESIRRLAEYRRTRRAQRDAARKNQ